MMKLSEEHIEVTVLVITYNSSKYVIDTLDSIKKQSYPFLYLVISDDCSTDNTVNICKQWINDNKERFIDVTVVTSNENTGISANVNRGECACRTKWVKGIAGDDVLLNDCISDNVKYVLENPDTVYLFSKIHLFGKSSNLVKNIASNYNYRLFSLSVPQQYERIIFHHDSIPAATSFYNLEKLLEYDIRCDERIPFLDDTPRYINVLKQGFPLKFLDKETVNYRVHSDSISTGSIASVNFFTSLRLYYYYYLRDEFINKYGLDWTIQNEVVFQKKLYEDYLQLRNSSLYKIYFFFHDLKKRVLFNISRIVK